MYWAQVGLRQQVTVFLCKAKSSMKEACRVFGAVKVLVLSDVIGWWVSCH
jgi:hypothetical protein